jgi:hypothetical protein
MSSLFDNRLLAKVKYLHFKSPSSGVPTPLWTLLKHYKLSKMERNSLPKHELLRDFEDN